MEDTLISFETAKIAQEKGFDWLCYSWFHITKLDTFDNTPSYYKNKAIADYIEIADKLVSHLVGGQHGKTINSKFKNSEDQPNILACPTQSLLQKWLREVHKINVSSDLWGYLGKKQLCTYQYNILKISPDSDYIKSHKPKSGTTYEEALEIGLKEALKLIK